MKIIKWLLSSKIGLALLIGIIAIATAGAAQFYFFEKPEIEKKNAIEEGAETLERIADLLEEASKSGGKWPEITTWFPKYLPCAAKVTITTIPPWNKLGFKTGSKTKFQYRLETQNDGYILRARTDSDCDGIFAIYTIEGTTDWPSSFRREFTIQNKKE